MLSAWLARGSSQVRRYAQGRLTGSVTFDSARTGRSAGLISSPTSTDSRFEMRANSRSETDSCSTRESWRMSVSSSFRGRVAPCAVGALVVSDRCQP